ncbi:MAG: hypothetical protein KJ692_11385 [Verrucomicrobia bacterium]|nr:hypothetical protein [Verrucomicrobiota bacterium]
MKTNTITLPPGLSLSKEFNSPMRPGRHEIGFLLAILYGNGSIKSNADCARNPIMFSHGSVAN